jgi:Tannase and feruloyl esterase
LAGEEFKLRIHSIIGRLLASFILLASIVTAPVSARNLPVVKHAISCADLKDATFALPGEAPARINSVAIENGHCTVKGYVAPQVGFEIRLPIDNWTQRMLFTGCGGFCGQANIRPQSVMGAETCAPIARNEMVTVASDLGHHSGGFGDVLWAVKNPQGRIDYGNRAVHVTTLAAKEIITRFYGQRPAFSYFSGCSDGGREGMMEVQRFPGDYDGIIAAAPVIHVTSNNSIHHAWVVQHLQRADGSAIFDTAALTTLHDRVLKSCGGKGPQSANVIDPTRCRFDPASMICTSNAQNCLTSEQATAAKELYAGPHDARGTPLYFGLTYGSELSWLEAAGLAKRFATDFLNYVIGDGTVDPDIIRKVSFTPEALVRYNAQADVMDAINPDISAFQSRGGKLIIWHGWSDISVPALGSIAYASAVKKTLGETQTDSFMRTYMLPGVYHCGGGTGPDKVDMLSPLMTWVEDGIAPHAITAVTRTLDQVTARAEILPWRASTRK